jgi:hypothetical protein
MLFDEVAGPVGAPDKAGVFRCGLRVVSMDGSTTDVPNSQENDDYFGRPSNAARAGAFPQVRWVVAAESGTGALIGATQGPYRVGEQTLGGPDHWGAPAVAGLGVVPADPDHGARRRQLPGHADTGP